MHASAELPTLRDCWSWTTRRPRLALVRALEPRPRVVVVLLATAGAVAWIASLVALSTGQCPVNGRGVHGGRQTTR